MFSISAAYNEQALYNWHTLGNSTEKKANLELAAWGWVFVVPCNLMKMWEWGEWLSLINLELNI